MCGSQRQNQQELLVVPGMVNNARTVLSEVWSVHCFIFPCSLGTSLFYATKYVKGP